MSSFGYTLIERQQRPKLGLIVLQSDETIEADMRRLLSPDGYDLFVSRVSSALEVTSDTLAEMEENLPSAAGLFPRAVDFSVVGYGCTSGTAVIGAQAVAGLIKSNCITENVTDPVSGLINACAKRNINRLAFLSPYIESVSKTLRATLADQGIQTPVFGSFNEAEETKVAKIDADSLLHAALELGFQDVDGVFLSCTNLKTLNVIPDLEAKLEKPVLSSNLVLAEHMMDLAALPS